MIIISREGQEALLLQAKDFRKFCKEVQEIKISSKYQNIQILYKSIEIIKIWDRNKEISAKVHLDQVYLQLCHQDKEVYMIKIKLPNKINIQAILAARAH